MLDMGEQTHEARLPVTRTRPSQQAQGLRGECSEQRQLVATSAHQVPGHGLWGSGCTALCLAWGPQLPLGVSRPPSEGQQEAGVVCPALQGQAVEVGRPRTPDPQGHSIWAGTLCYRGAKTLRGGLV